MRSGETIGHFPHRGLHTSRPKQDCLFADDFFTFIFFNSSSKFVVLWFKFHWTLVPRAQLVKRQHRVKIIARRLTGDMPLSEPIVAYMMTHVCVTRSQCVNLVNSGRTGPEPDAAYIASSGIVLCIRLSNERRCYSVKPSHIGWAHAQNDRWYVMAWLQFNAIKGYSRDWRHGTFNNHHCFLTLLDSDASSLV